MPLQKEVKLELSKMNTSGLKIKKHATISFIVLCAKQLLFYM